MSFAALLKYIGQQFSVLTRLLSSAFASNLARFDALDMRQRDHYQLLREVSLEIAAQRDTLDAILTAVTLPPAVTAILAVEVEDQTQTIEGENIHMKIAQGKKLTASVTLKNAAGGPGKVDGVPTWKASVDGVVTVTPAADGLSAEIVTLPVPADQPVSSVIVTFDADGDLGDGVKDIVATLELTVFDAASDAVVAEITTSDPVDA